MRVAPTIIFSLCLMPVFAQLEGWEYSEFDDFDKNIYNRKYPYVKPYSPSFLGLIVGYNALKAQEVEAGLAYNFFEGLTELGMTSGYQLIYKRSLERQRNAIDLELGVYGAISMGIGVNYNFSNEISAVGFKPFIGTSIYHFQVLYGYNFLRKKKQEWYDLPKHSLSIRYVLPLIARKQTRYYLAPAPTYDNARGLHKDHPVKAPNFRYNRGYRY